MKENESDKIRYALSASKTALGRYAPNESGYEALRNARAALVLLRSDDAPADVILPVAAYTLERLAVLKGRERTLRPQVHPRRNKAISTANEVDD